MKKKRKFMTGALVIAALTVLSLAVCVYLKQLTQAIDASVVASMQELSRHDVQSLQSELENSWDSLSAVYHRVQSGRCEHIQDVCMRLNLEQQTIIFSAIYLVDVNGNTYSSNNLVGDDSDKEYVRPLLSGEQNYVMRYDDVDVLEALTENLVYGVSCEPFEVDGIQFIGAIGFSRISQIAERLKIDSFDGNGYTGIIDSEGNFIVNRDRSAGIGKIDNYFAQLRERTDLPENQIQEIITRLGDEEESLLHFNDVSRGEQVAAISAISGTSWSIVVTVPQKVFRDQTQQFIFMTAVMLAVVVIVLCLMMIAVIRLSLTSATAKAEAKSRSEFLSNMSHEIRTPLNGIIGLNHLMQQNTANPDKLAEYIRKSDSTAKYLLSLVNDILDMSKLQSQKMELVLKPFSVDYLIETTEALVRSHMEDRGLDFQIESDVTYPNLVGDETRIQQILVNILSNAAKFTSKGGRVVMRISQSEADGRVMTTYEVEDTGCGMSEEFQKRIFEPFSQESGNAQNSQGTGLGMSISSLLAKQMGGTLSVKSRLGVGSCFTFVMTADVAQEHLAPTKIKQDPIPHSQAKDDPLKILVAEDNALNAEILMEILNAAGFFTVLAVDGGKAVEQFEQSMPGEFDVILMDVQMPVLNGFEAARRIRALSRPDAKTILIYACTANTFKEDQDEALAAGMNGFIAKPIDVNKLMWVLEQQNGGDKT